MSKITPCLWFATEAEAAMNFYVSIFKHARVLEVTRYGDAGPGPKGDVMVVSFEIEGQKFMALNGNSDAKFNEAISLAVDCQDQVEVDELWTQLTADGGAPIQCGWLQDKFGVRWQIVPSILLKRISDPDPVKSARVMRAMMQMVKLDIARIEQAYAGE